MNVGVQSLLFYLFYIIINMEIGSLNLNETLNLEV